MKITYIKPLSLAKIFGAIHASFGLIIGIIFIGMGIVTQDSTMIGTAIPLGVGATLFYGLMGFVMGLVGGWAYNICAKYIGGLEIETE